jgi:hypothetical protein
VVAKVSGFEPRQYFEVDAAVVATAPTVGLDPNSPA